MRKYTREDVDLHRQGYYGAPLPAVNVKGGNYFPASILIERYGCSEKTAEKAFEMAWECAVEDFWDTCAPAIVEDVFGKRVKFWSEGRSGGWLVVSGLAPVDEWDAIAIGKWRSFEKRIKAEVKYLTSKECVLDNIDANGWCEMEERDQTSVISTYTQSLDELKA